LEDPWIQMEPLKRLPQWEKYGFHMDFMVEYVKKYHQSLILVIDAYWMRHWMLLDVMKCF
jgi:hypothetical protein